MLRYANPIAVPAPRGNDALYDMIFQATPAVIVRADCGNARLNCRRLANAVRGWFAARMNEDRDWKHAYKAHLEEMNEFAETLEDEQHALALLERIYERREQFLEDNSEFAAFLERDAAPAPEDKGK